MPSATPTTSSATADASSPASGCAQEASPQAARKEQSIAAATTTGRCPRRQEPSSSSSSSSSSSGSPPAPHTQDVHHRSLRLHVGVFSKRKGVRYNAEGHVVKCRFCEILRDRDEPFLYEDELLVVFRPLHPIVPSHILIVPRAHIRNVNQLNLDHVTLLRRMRAVADRVLHTHPDLQATGSEGDHAAVQTKSHAPKSPVDVSDADHEYRTPTEHATLDEDDETPSDADCRFAFHVPPFNSIDHVHMHAFRGHTGYFGRIKYRTESWWCRSYDEVLARLELHNQHQPTASHSSRRLQEVPTTAPVASS